jgi:subtilisin family serine protease
VKVLSGIGFGTTSQLLEGIDEAHKWGAQVLNLSLGGPLQGSALEDDPVCRLVDSYDDMICVAAAGNDGREWSIGTPGAARSTITVGSWGLSQDRLSAFSSRGPSGEFYRDNPDIWRRDLRAVGDDLIKPDVVAPGGDQNPEEKILSGSAGWYDLLSDIVPGWGGMHGSSMATPIVSGSVAILLDRGKIKTARDFKRRMAESCGTQKSSEVGYGLFHFSRFD